MKGYKLSKYVKMVFETPSKEYSEWFGYYNYDTLNSEHSKLLCNRIKEDGIKPRANLRIEVGYYDISSREWHHVGFSDSWNWQQGCMSQWLNDEEIIYNSSENNHHIAIIHNIKTGTNRKINWAIYGITPDKKKSIALDMERAHWCRAYHYESVIDEEKDGLIYEQDGIFEIDLENNTRKRLISIYDIIGLDSRPYFKNAKHWVEHVMISPTGEHFCFLHRFSAPNDIYNYKTRLIIVNMKTLEMHCIPNWELTQWSHFAWNKDSFVVYSYPVHNAPVSADSFKSSNVTVNNNLHCSRVLNVKHILEKILKIFYKTFVSIELDDMFRHNRKHYQYYSFHDNSYVLSKRFKNKLFDIDGHPSFTPDGKYMITDTYPDKNNKQRLIIFNTYNNKCLVLGVFNAYYKGNPASCDLHPKLSGDGLYVVLDSAHDKKHHMLMLELNWKDIKKKIS